MRLRGIAVSDQPQASLVRLSLGSTVPVEIVSVSMRASIIKCVFVSLEMCEYMRLSGLNFE